MKYWIDEKTGIKMCEPDCADEWMKHIWEAGVDYDGYRDAKNLMELIDELIEYSKKARQCLRDGKIFSNPPAD